MEGTDPGEKVRSTYWEALKKNWMVWPAVQAVNFKFVPLEHRVLVVNVVSLGEWSYVFGSSCSFSFFLSNKRGRLGHIERKEYMEICANGFYLFVCRMELLPELCEQPGWKGEDKGCAREGEMSWCTSTVDTLFCQYRFLELFRWPSVACRSDI